MSFRKIISIGVIYAALFALPFALKLHQQDFMIILVINVLIVVSYRLMTLTGEFSLIHVVLMGAGAYTSALLAKTVGLSFWLSMPLGGVVAALLALLLSFPLFRMKGFYFLIGSFAVGEAIRLSWSYFDFFGGPKGIKLIPSPHLYIPGLGMQDIWQPIPYYYLVLTIVSLCLLVLYRLEHSRIGLTMNAIHWRDALAESVGVDTWRYRTMAFVIASFFAGIGGALLAHYIGTINPVMFDVTTMVYVLIWVIVGGTNTFYGPIIGVVLLSILNEMFREAEQLRPLVYGILLLAVMRFLPNGLDSLPGKIRDYRRRKHEADSIDTAGNAISKAPTGSSQPSTDTISPR